MRFQPDLTILNFRIKSFTFSLGWYNGNNWKGIQGQLLNFMGGGWVVLLSLEILKFELYISLDAEK